MEKASLTSTESSSTTTTNNNNNSRDRDRDQFLKHVNKLSHKISKPKKPPSFDNIHNNATLNNHLSVPHQGVTQSQPLVPPPPLTQTQSQPLNLHQQPQHQPPVYNINKSDFRDVVQKLTGSPAHDRFNTPPPIQPPKPTSSRLQKIRPPPLPQINTPPPLNPSFLRQPLSPLPPFPAVHAAAESPISAYMRYIQNSTFPSPRWSNLVPPAPPPENIAPASSVQFPAPSSYGCVPSPKSPYPSLFSPATLGFPLSPTVPSPRWKGN